MALTRIASSLEKQPKGIRVDRTHAEEEVIKLFAWRGRVRVKIEVSPVLRGCVRVPTIRGVNQSVASQFGYIEVPVVHWHDLYAGKLCAALDRQHPRDLFDVQLLLEHEGVDDALMEVFVIYLISGDRSITDMLAPKRQPLTTIFEEQFLGMALRPVTVQELEHTRETMIALIGAALTERQRQFLLSFKHGEPDWNLLNLDRIDALPAVQWKLENIRRMTPGKREQAVARLRGVLYG